MKHFQNCHPVTNLFLSRFRESGRPFNQAYGNVFLRGLIYGVLVMGISSCGSSKPRVVTTKKEAAKAGAITSTSKPRPRTNSNATIKREEVEHNTEVKEYAISTDFIDEVVENAKNYEGVRYRYGGTTTNGMDCSGLISVAFQEAGKSMPRTSRALYAEAKELSLDQARKGDFLFFATGRNKKQVNHVALITKVTPAEIEFIHSTTSRGVITSTLNEAYWLNAFLRAGRID
ncbi:C40 family peptidase [Nonlabens sp.]|jgi:cell wall-associated NlpC family hydrolase|uniref:C40 family peptidase n=1 Tax=Nonlabens sp. TaxID=1888209 RepID=UPI003F6A1868